MYLWNCILRKMLSLLAITYALTIKNVAFSDTLEATSTKYTRKAKIWPLEVGIVKFEHGGCRTPEGYDGTCYTRRQCKHSGGIGSRSCAQGIGTCCIYQYTCGGTSSSNNTYFVNTGFPDTTNTAGVCTFTIQKCSEEICQVRIELLSLILAQPDANGNCVTDSLAITGGASNLPRICGENSGQHMYVNFNGDADIKIIVSVGPGSDVNRAWNIKASQIGCDCPTLAPQGCLMYHTSLSGNVKSFNYGINLNGALLPVPTGQVGTGTRQMVNLNYGVCVQMIPGYCSIRWSQGPGPYSFTVSNDTAAQELTPGLPSGGITGQNCTTDFVVIPNSYFANGTAVNTDRFCGNQLPTVTTSSKPFVLTVVTDGDDMADVANRGFCLNYQQLPCGNLNFAFKR